MNTFAASTSRIPRTGLIALVALVAAFAALMVVRLGVLDSSDSVTPVTAPPEQVVTPTTTPAKPKIVLLPDLPADVAHGLRYSRVLVVSLYVGQAAADRAAVTPVRQGARAAGAGFVAVNVGSDAEAQSYAAFAGPASTPAVLVVRRPGKIVTQISGPVDSAVVTQAAYNAGARR